jgi:hypothetical protein
MKGRGEYREWHDPKRSLCLSMPPPLIPQFFIGRESLKDVWVNKLRMKEKDISHEQGKGRIQVD